MKDIFALHLAEYESAPEVIAVAPAVMKLLGEHTASHEGLVIAAPISYEMRVAISRRKDTSMRFFAADLNERKRSSAGNLKFKREDRWANHVKSVYDYFIQNFNIEARGINVTINGTVPPGLGLGISAAINMAVALALKTLYGLSPKNEELAEIACKAQSVFFEKPFSLVDYLAATAPGLRSLSIIDLRTSRRRAVQFLDESWKIILSDSKVPRTSVEAELKQRHDDCRKCLQHIPGSSAKALRDIKLSELDELMGVFPESMRRRCIHVVEEIVRVQEAEDALIRQDALAFGRVINKSQASLRNHFEISCPEIDWLAKRSLEIPGVLCSRMTSNGFGGCVYSIMKEEALETYRKRLEEYERIFGFKAPVYEISIKGNLRATLYNDYEP